LHNFFSTSETSDLAACLLSRAQQAQGVHAVSKGDGVVLSMGYSIQDKFSGQLADTAPIEHVVDGQFS